METEASSSAAIRIGCRNKIVQRLIQVGVPAELLGELQRGLVVFSKANKSRIPELVCAILPTDEDAKDMVRKSVVGGLRGWLRESLVWLQWMMFEGDPRVALKKLAEMSEGRRAVCGTSWGPNELAYCCKTCEHDPSCAICVPCFQNGNHEGHDYSIINTGNGCCDCGDVTAWKPEGFCSKHKGVVNIRPLEDEYSVSMGLVLDAVLISCQNNLLHVEAMYHEKPTGGSPFQMIRKTTSKLVAAVAGMLLEFCRHSESLLCLICRRMLNVSGLLNTLVRAERYLSGKAVKILRELLLKLLGDPEFKYEFAKAFVNYYPTFVQSAIQENGDAYMKKLSILPSFSVQLFTVPTVTPRLVKEENVMAMLLGCLEDIFSSCSGEDGCLVVSQWARLYEITLHAIHDIGYVMSNDEVPIYLLTERHDILRKWFKLLGFLQGMDSFKRETGLHVEEENETVHMPFVLCHYLEEIHSCLVSGVFLSSQLQETSNMPMQNLDTTHMDIENDDFSCDEMRKVSQENYLSVTAGSASGLAPVPDFALPDKNSACQFPTAGFGICLIGMCLKEIEKKLNAGGALEASQIFKADKWLDLDYDVSSQEISVHIPLHRLLAALLQKALEKYCGASSETNRIYSCFSGPSLAVNNEAFDYFLNGCSSYGFSSFFMEHPLRVRVFCAQVYAGMWRKNGYAVLYACELYGNVQWSDQCVELDLFMLQCCAVLVPADAFVNRILQRFGLSNYISMDVKQSNEYEPTLMKEMLNLLIQIVKERRFCGLSTVESLKRELIRRLAIGDATHSQLLKSLPPDLKCCDVFSDILNDIAAYSNPSGFTQGKFSLKKEYWKELDLYHPRWRPKDLQVAEERYLHFCGTSAVTAQLPKWSKIYQPLNGIARIATCKVVLQLTRAVIYYACVTDDQTSSRAPNGLLLTALHLLSLAIDICLLLKDSNCLHHGEDSIPLIAFACEKIDKVKTDIVEEHSLLSLLVLLMRKCMKDDLPDLMESGSHYLYVITRSLLVHFAELDTSCMNYLRVFAPEVVGSLSSPGLSSSIGTQSMNLNNDKHKEKARMRQAAILAKMKAEQSKFLESISAELDDSGGLTEEGKEDDIDETTDSEHVCSLCHAHSRNPLSIPVLLQKSKLVRLFDKGMPSWELAHEPERRKLPDHMHKHIGKSCLSRTSMFATDMTLESNDTNHYLGNMNLLDIENELTCHFTKTNMTEFQSMENLEADLYSSVWKYVHDYMNGATSLSNAFESLPNMGAEFSSSNECLAGKTEKKTNDHSETTITKSPEDEVVSGSSFQFGYDSFAPADCDGIFISSCGHGVHQKCLDRYLSSLRKRKFASEGTRIVDPNKGEFLCPLCRLVANSALPRSYPRIKKQQGIASGLFPTIGHSEAYKDKFFHIRQAICLLQTTAVMVSNIKALEDFPDKPNERLSSNSSPFLLALKAMYLGKNGDECSTFSSGSQSTIMWDALKYSLIATEIGARSKVTSLTPSYGLDSLYEGIKTVGKDLLSMFLDASETIRTGNHTDVLLRFKGVQLFAKSVCVRHPRKASSSSTSDHAGNSNRSLYKLKQTGTYHDAAFLELASEPVLAHDPFSSLMWIFFCLPSPFLACKESFISIVHIFYVVSVAQAIVTYCADFNNKLAVDAQDTMIHDLLNAMCDARVLHHFRSNYVDPSCGIKTFIHRLTFPYLRRCALLSRLLGLSSVENFPDRPIHDTMNTSSHLRMNELSEIQTLHNMFGIPSLDDVLKDGALRYLAINWYHHWDKCFTKDKLQHILYSTPAVPFRLMHLPNIYQDILQRYLNQQCSECGSVPKEPALCLLCGNICSSFWKPCCRGSECKLHAATCGAGTGIFLLIRQTTIILLSGVREGSWPSLYLDAYGEEDIGLQRGRPLFLNEERYATLCQMVATHSFDRDSKVLHKATTIFEI